MAIERPSWFDWINLGATLVLAGAGIVVAFVVAQSADHGTRVSTMVATSTFLLDTDPSKQNVGVEIGQSLISEARTDHIPWFEQLVGKITNVPLVAPSGWEEGSSKPPANQPPLPTSAPEPQAAPTATAPQAAPTATAPQAAPTAPVTQGAPTAPATPTAPTADATGPGPRTASQSHGVGERLFDALGGVSPRLYIQISDPSQRAGADILRQALAGSRLPRRGQSVIAPGVELVKRTPTTLELRWLRRGDGPEAADVADLLKQLLGVRPKVVPIARFLDDPSVQPRTYELWFPQSMTIDVSVPPAQ